MPNDIPKYAAVCEVPLGEDSGGFDSVFAAVPIDRDLIERLRALRVRFAELTGVDRSARSISLEGYEVLWLEINPDNPYKADFDDPADAAKLEVLWNSAMESGPGFPSDHPEIDAAFAALLGRDADWAILPRDVIPSTGNVRTEINRLTIWGFRRSNYADDVCGDFEWSAHLDSDSQRLVTLDVTIENVAAWEKLLSG